MSVCYRCFIKLKSLCLKSERFSTSCIYNGREMSLFKDDHINLLKERPKLDRNLRSLKIAILGAPNAGKSLLTNKLVAWKFAPVSSKVHTTRTKMIGVHTEGENQLIFMDTPGVIQPSSLKKHNLERSLLVDPHVALFDSHLIGVVVDVSHIWHRMRLDENVLRLLEYHKDKPSILILNKIDLLKRKHDLLDVTRRLTNGCIQGLPYINTSPKSLTSDDIIKNFKSKYSQPKIEENNSLDTNFEPGNDATLINDSSDNNHIHFYNHNYIDDKKSFFKLDKVNSTGNLPKISLNAISNIHHYEKNDSSNNINKIDANNDEYKTDLNNNYNINNVQNEEIQRMIEKPSDLYDAVKWNEYYLALKKMGSRHQNGWPNFSEVFMVSALTGDGIFDLKNYLSSKTFKSKWEYSSSVVTNVGPMELAKLCVREKLMDHVPNDVAHSVEIRKITWEISDDNLLRARFDIVCKRKRQASLIMGANGATIQQISREAKQSLMNAFKRELTLHLVVKFYEEKK